MTETSYCAVKDKLLVIYKINIYKVQLKKILPMINCLYGP